MALNELTRGKNLKPFLCLVKELYHKNLNLPDKAILLKKLKGYFPYYHEDTLNFVIEKAYEVLSSKNSSSRSNKLSKLYNFFFYTKYGPETERINSPNLYHFSKKEYLLKTLKNNFIYPTVLSINEYKSLVREYQGGLSNEKDSILNNRFLQEKWSKSEKTLIDFNSKSAKSDKIEKFIASSSLIPAVTCFTELSGDQIGLHADHYGSYGIKFRKEALVIREYFFDSPDITPHFIRPIYYCDNSKCSIPWLILKRIIEIGDDPEKFEELRKLMIDLALIKPIDQTLLSPKNIYSVIYEKEWRFVSFEKLFRFKTKDVKRVLVSKSDYQAWLEGANDPLLEEILNYCEAKKVLVEKV